MKKYLNQDEFDEEFFKACNNNDVNIATNLLNNYYLKQQKSHLNSFLSICGLGYPALTLNPGHSERLKKACDKGYKEVVELFLNNTCFLKEANNLKIILHCFTGALAHGQLQILDFLHPLIKNKDQYYYNTLIYGLLEACQNNQLNSVKYVFNKKDLEFSKYKNFYSELEVDERGSVPARFISRAQYSNSTDILHYFAFELNPFYQQDFLIELKNQNVNLNILQKLETYKELQNKIDTSNDIKSKRLKI